jgi:hypothetical protein
MNVAHLEEDQIGDLSNADGAIHQEVSAWIK